MPTTIIIKHGYRTLAIPFTERRIAALVDLMENSAQVSIDWNGSMNAAEPDKDEKLVFTIREQEIPIWIALETTKTENEND